MEFRVCFSTAKYENDMLSLSETPSDKRCVMQRFLTYICIDINETVPSLVIFLGVDRFYAVRFFLCRVYKYAKFDPNKPCGSRVVSIFTARP